KLADIYIRFDIPGQLSTDFSKLDSLVEIGRLKTQSMIDKIKNYIRNQERAYLNQIDTTKQQLYKIASIKIEGLNQIEESKIREAIPFDSLFLKPSGYGDLQNLIAQVYQTGNFKNIKGFLIRENQEYSLIIRVEENPILTNILFQNNSIYTDSVLLKQMNYPFPQIINHFEGQNALIQLLKFYRNNGYSLAHIHSVKLKENGILEIILQEGRIKKIKVEGNQQTKAFVILREFPLKAGDVFHYEQVKKGIENIYGTGLFNTVRLNITYDDNQPVLTIKVDEKKFNLIRLGGQYNTERKGNGFIELVNENIFGTGNPLTLHIQNGERNKRYGLYFRSDRIFKTFLTTQFNIYYQKNKYFSYRGFEKSGEYNEIRSGMNFSLGQQMARWGNVSLEGSYYYIGYNRLWGQPLHAGELLLSTFALRSVVDTRDQYPFPMKGKYYHFFYELSSANILSSEVSYFKLFSSLENFLSISTHHTFHPKIVWGTSDLTTPLAEQYYLGGENNFLALREHQLYGRHLMSTSLEYRYMLPKIFPLNTYLHFQMNLAGIWGTKVSIKSKDFLFGTEMKISFLSPFGPFIIAYGRTRDKQTRFYFSAGYDF
ncbi:BamA/TamA family outer membrane protein, partial [candidate division KSB1 bacterium]|nr:BamA/TamA family outer membrane protein [candidate division KSB1 bacterium]